MLTPRQPLWQTSSMIGTSPFRIGLPKFEHGIPRWRKSTAVVRSQPTQLWRQLSRFPRKCQFHRRLALPKSKLAICSMLIALHKIAYLVFARTLVLAKIDRTFQGNLVNIQNLSKSIKIHHLDLNNKWMTTKCCHVPC